MKKIFIPGLMAMAMLLIGVSAALANQIYLPLVHKPGTTSEPPPGLQVLSNHSSFIDISNRTHVFGEVLNNTEDDLEYVNVGVNFLASNGQLIETDFTTAFLDTLAARDHSCFHLEVNVPSPWLLYQFEVPYGAIYTLAIPTFSIHNPNGVYDPSNGQYVLIGSVTNDNNYSVTEVIVVATLYNSLGTVIGCDFDWVDTIDLASGQTSPFMLNISIPGRDYSDVASYRLQVHGDPP